MKGGYRSFENVNANSAASQVSETWRLGDWRTIVVVSIFSVIVAVVGCLLMAHSHNIKPEKEQSCQEIKTTRMEGKSLKVRVIGFGKEFYYGVKYALTWPVKIVERTFEIVKGGRAIERLDALDRLRYIFFPYNTSSLAILRFGGIVVALTGLGYFFCWIGLKSRFGWFSYVGLLYFVYLLIIAVFIICLEVTK